MDWAASYTGCKTWCNIVQLSTACPLCCFSHTIWLARSSLTPALTSFWTRSHLSLPLKLVKSIDGMLLNLARPLVTVPTSALWCSFDSVRITASWAFYFVQVFNSITGRETLGSLDFLCCSTSLVQLTLNSSVIWWVASAYLCCHTGWYCLDTGAIPAT